MSRGDKTPKDATQRSRAAEKKRLGAQRSGRNIQAPPKKDYKPTVNGPAIPEPSQILAGETFRSRKPSSWKIKPRRRDK